MFLKRNTKRILGIAALIILMFAVALHITDVFGLIKGFFTVLTPVIIGVCLAFILNILVKFFENPVFSFLDKCKKPRKKLKKALSIIATYIVFFGAVALLLLVIIPQVTRTAAAIVAGFPAFIDRSMLFIRGILERFGITSERISQILLGSENFLERISDFAQKNVGSVISSVGTVGGSVISSVVNFFLGLFLSVYMLLQRDLILSQLKRFFKAVFKRNAYNGIHRIVHISVKAFENFIGGQFLEALILGTLCFIGMTVLRIPYALIVSVLVSVSALIPILGAWIGGGISALLILIADPVKALWFVIFLVVLQQLEGNLIYPRVVGQQIGLPGVWVLAAVILGNGFFGPFGALFCVPLTSIVYTVAGEFTRFVEQTRKEKELQ